MQPWQMPFHKICFHGDRLGNLLDIAAAGGYYHWLKALHAQYGDVVAFHNLDKLTVSVCTPELYRSVKHAFDRPRE